MKKEPTKRDITMTEMLVEVEEPIDPTVSRLFDAHKRGRAVIRCVLELGRGKVLVDNLESPRVAAMVFKPLVFLAGDSRHPAAAQYVSAIPQMNIMIAPDEEWEDLIRRSLGSKILVQKRTRLVPESLNLKRIRALKKMIPEEFGIARMDREIVERLDEDMRKPIDFYFGGVEGFTRDAIGFCVMKDGAVASVAYSAFPFVEEFEIQVETAELYRRKGLATVACAALIEHALEHGLVPRWDAANEPSVQLALKLGYSEPDRWFAYFWRE